MNKRQIKNMAYNMIYWEVKNHPQYFTKKGKIRKSLKANGENIALDYDGNLIVSFYLGSLINPSGKYYLPFACSSVTDCSVCHGTGHTKKLYPCQYCTNGKRYVSDIRKAGYIHIMIDITEGRIPTFTDEIGEYIICVSCNGSGMIHKDCKYCGGLGSREAYEDSVFWEYMDNYASKHGGYIESGESDPCDTFLCFVVKSSTERDD